MKENAKVFLEKAYECLTASEGKIRNSCIL